MQMSEALPVVTTLALLMWLMFKMFRGSSSEGWWNRYMVYPVTWALAVQLGRGEHLLPILAFGTALRYLVNLTFTIMSKLDWLAEPLRIQRVNPPAEQHDRELDWDGPVILSPLAFVLVDAVTPWLREERVVPFCWESVLAMFMGHYLIVEPLYYAFHVALHTHQLYKHSHVHHHTSTVTEAISGTSHPMLETLCYLANFSFSFMLPAWLGLFSLELIPFYLAWFDVMNCIGHCNFEVVPRFLQFGPLKYLVYTSSYHSLHHTKYKYNYCLFCPIWDYIGGTVHPTTERLHEKVLSHPPRQLEAVFLGHGVALHSMLHLPWFSPYLATRKHHVRWWMVPLQPLMFVWAIICRYLFSTSCMQRYQFRGTECATWCLPVTGHFYVMKSHHKAIADRILKAVRDADDMGVKYFGLGALNKAEWINHGGSDIVDKLEKHRKIKVVHGNTLTAAAVWEALKQHTLPGEEIVFAGSTSKIGRALCILLARRGNIVCMITGSKDRFESICSGAGDAAKNLRRLKTYEETRALPGRAWIIGKWMSEEQIKDLIAPGALIVDFAVPHVPKNVSSPYRYVNGAALTFSRKDTDLTFCHDVPNTVPACMAATIIHAREDTGEHECGELGIEEVDRWWAKAVQHGFSLACPHPDLTKAGGCRDTDEGAAKPKAA
jgi:sterol desaturase/sphingolipid hydroxylase (fatty acid hydroxylase superfamily)/predicted amino acid dehydrogenase